MNSFYAGFEKQAGLKEFWGKIKSFFGGKTPTPETSAPAERKAPKYFYSKKFDPGHIKNINSAIRKNYSGGQSNLVLKYKKADGSIVERKVTPYTAKNSNLMLGHDHHRGEIRSFRVDRIQNLRSE